MAGIAGRSDLECRERHDLLIQVRCAPERGLSFGLDRSRHDAVDSDATRPRLARKRAGKPDHCRPGGRMGDHTGSALDP
jgi:hypothetical protein